MFLKYECEWLCKLFFEYFHKQRLGNISILMVNSLENIAQIFLNCEFMVNSLNVFSSEKIFCHRKLTEEEMCENPREPW